MARLGHAIAAFTVREILHAAGIDPAPRQAGPSWREFLAAQAHAIIACDFLVVETVLVFKAEGPRIMTTLPRTPRMNAICERVIGTLRRELLDRTLVLRRTPPGPGAPRVLGPLQRPQAAPIPAAAALDIETQSVRGVAHLRSIRRKPLVAGVINEYHHAA